MSQRRSVLIVDDEFGLAEMLRETLREDGYDVSLAINGRLAFDILRERQIDLVITDLMMPVMDGAELAAAIRGDEAMRGTAVLLMTSLPSRMPDQSGLYDAIIRKPFTPALLLGSMNACFIAQRSRVTPPLANTSSSSDSIPPTIPEHL
jgi:DNA-binding response OmpR family regulator